MYNTGLIEARVSCSLTVAGLGVLTYSADMSRLGFILLFPPLVGKELRITGLP